jgi:hypothetical protein
MAPTEMDILTMAAPPQDAMPDIMIEEDGSVTITLPTEPESLGPREERGFRDNLAEVWDQQTINSIANDLTEGINQDLQNRGLWMTFYQQATNLLGCSVSDAASAGSGATADTGVSKLKSTTLLSACITFQANATSEMFPANGPVKPRMNLMLAPELKDLPKTLAEALNEYFTVTDRGYALDFDRSMFHLAFGGMMFRKVYRCPLRRRPTSEMIPATRMIISDAAKSLTDTPRFAHEIPMSQGDMKKLQAAGHFCKKDIPLPSLSTTSEQKLIDSKQGIAATTQRPEDTPYKLYEIYVETYIEADKIANPNKLPRPYVITMEADSQAVLRITRNWEEDDPDCRPLEQIIDYSMFPGLGYWAYGFALIMQSPSRTATALINLMVDSGIFANFPAGLRASSAKTSESTIRPMPGQFPKIDLPPEIDDIRKAVMALPYRSPDPFLLQLLQHIEGWMSRLAGVAELPDGSNMANTPVGSIVASIDQAIKPITAVHKRCFKSMEREFAVFVRLFKEDPGPLLPRYASPEQKERIVQALHLAGISPVADPNVPSLAYRVMLFQALLSLVEKNPELYDVRKVHERALRALGLQDYEDLLKPEDTEAPPDPSIMFKMAELELKKATVMLKKVAEKNRQIEKMADMRLKEEGLKAALAEQIRESEDASLDRASRERIAASRERQERIKYTIELAKALGMFGLDQPQELDPTMPVDLRGIV